MEYGPSDSSGTDDDLPPPHQNRGTRGRIAVNGRTGVTLPYTTRAQLDMEAEIHQLEQEAYSSVLRAFKAQSDLLTWEKETLITELRTELKVSDIEHRELLSMVNADDLIRRIREWRKTGGRQPGLTNHAQPVPDPLPSPSVSGSRKRKATSQSIPSLSLTVPSPAMHPQPIGASMQPISAVKHGPLGTKGKKPKPNPSTGITGRGHLSNRGVPGVVVANELVETAAYDPLIGRKVMTRWPEDNNFYEAVITDYDPQKRLHALVYDINTNNETWEWVNLKEISPEDIRWESEDPGFQNRGVRGGAGRGIKKPPGRSGNVIPSGLGRGRGPLKHQSKKDLRISQNGIGKRGSDDIELLNTDSLLKEVERIFSASPLDLVEVEKAKKVLKEHEQALIDAISRLAEASDGESADCDQSFP